MQGGDGARVSASPHPHVKAEGGIGGNIGMHRRVPIPPQLRLSSLVNLSSAPSNLHLGGTVGCHDDAESPVDVRALANVHTPSTPVPNGSAKNSLQLPELSQNEIKKAQNRKSAKRFREAQKRRWQLLNRELEAQKRLVEELRRSQNTNHGNGGGRKMSIGTLTTSTEIEVDTEASLYAQLLCSSINGGTGAYVGELGALHRCVLMDRHGTIKGLRRGNAVNGNIGTGNSGGNGNTNSIVGENLFKHISHFDTPNVRNALVTAVDIVAIGYVRNGQRFNAVVKPVPNCDDVLLAEFLPFTPQPQTQVQQVQGQGQQQGHVRRQQHPLPGVVVPVQHHNHVQPAGRMHHHHQRGVAPVPHHMAALDALPPGNNINKHL